MIDYEKLRKAPYMSKRIYTVKAICEQNNVEIEYLFGLFDLFNKKNRGKWFWQKASFTGSMKEDYDKFNKAADNIAKGIKTNDERQTMDKISQAGPILASLIQKMEINLEVDREKDTARVKGFIDNNLKTLIDDGLRRLE